MHDARGAESRDLHNMHVLYYMHGGLDWVISLYFSSYGKIKAVVSPRCGEDDAFVVAIDIVLYYSFKLQLFSSSRRRRWGCALGGSGCWAAMNVTFLRSICTIS